MSVLPVFVLKLPSESGKTSRPDPTPRPHPPVEKYKQMSPMFKLQPGQLQSIKLNPHLEHVSKEMALWKKASRQKQCDALGNALLGNLESWNSYGCDFTTYHLPKHEC